MYSHDNKINEKKKTLSPVKINNNFKNKKYRKTIHPQYVLKYALILVQK